ncbi:MAG: pitrilysin family protein [bacterium]|nr:pitrilysin family protein [bacterium]
MTLTQPHPTLSLPGAHNIHRETLPNGIVVLVYENFAAQSVVISGSIRAGSQFETPAQNGLASLTASALLRGTAQYDFDTINERLESAAADLDFGGAVHRTSFSGKALAEDLPLLIDLLAEAVRRPAFPAAQIERLRGELLTFLNIRQQDTRYRAGRAFSETLFPPDHPYHYSTRGTLETVPTLSVDDLTAFHARHYGPAGMILVIVGAVKADEALRIVRDGLGDWTNAAQPEPPSIPQVEPLRETRRAAVGLAGKTQSDIVLGVVGPSRFAPDYQAASLANSVLGQFGMMGRIGHSVRETLGLAYYAYSALDGGYAPSPWSVTAGVNPANVELAIARITDELRRLSSEPISADDLADNQSYFTGRLPLQLETNEGIAGSILNMEIYGLGLDYLVTYRDRIYALTADDVLAAARQYLTPDALVIAVAGPA